MLDGTFAPPEAPPFLGLLPFDAARAAQARQLVQRFLGGDAGRLPLLFRHFPHVAAWSVTHALSDSYGGDGHGVYRHIERALGIRLDGQAQRLALHEAFCAVCERFGLPTRGFDRLVDVYLLHAGVPMALLPHLVEAFRRQDRAFGPPPVGSTVLLNRWEDDALDFLSPAVTTPRRPVLWDETAWHAALYARILADPDAFVPASAFETRFAELLRAARNAPAPTGDANAPPPRPRLIWAGGGLALRLPRLQGRLQLRLDEAPRALRLRSGEDWPLPEPWPRRLDWPGGSQRFLDGPGQFAVFDLATGRLCDELTVSGRAPRLDAAGVAILAREPFALDGDPALPCGAEGFVAFARLRAAATVLTMAEGSLALRARPRRRLTVQGAEVGRGPLGPLHGPAARLCLETGLERAETRWLAISAGGRRAEREIVTAPDGTAELSLAELLGPFPELRDAAPLRLRVELLAPPAAECLGQPGPRISVAAWLWPGFLGAAGNLLDSVSAPGNVLPEQSRHVVTDDAGRLCLDPAGDYAVARAVFAIEGRAVPFDLPWPDVTVTRRRADGTEQALPLGSRLTLGEEDRFDTLSIRCPDPDAALLVCGRTEPRPFALGMTRNLALRQLMEAPGNGRVVLRRGNGREAVLVELVPALAPRALEFLPARGALRLRLAPGRPVDALALALEDELGRRDLAMIAVRHRPVESPPPDWLSAMICADDADMVELTVALDGFDDGITLAQLLVRPEAADGWQPLRTGRGDTHALALVAEGAHAAKPADALARRFESLCRWLSDCHAAACWPLLDRTLTPRWQALGRALVASPGGAGAVMRAAALPPPAHTSRSWVPIAHPLQFMPDLYAAPPTAFAALAAVPDPGVAGMSAIATLRSGRLREKDHLHPTAFLGFRNRLEADRSGVRLEGFCPARFFAVLPAVDSDPSAGCYWRGAPLLGPDHWRAAHQRFAERLEEAGLFTAETADDGPNSRRQHDLQRLVHAAWRDMLVSERPPAPKRSPEDDEPFALDLWASATLSGFARASRAGRASAWAAGLAHTLGWEPGRALTTLALLLRLAPELFGFHLLLWQIAQERP